MSEADEIDRYFTEQIVGGIDVIEMGPAANTQAWSEQGVLIDRLDGEATLMALAARSLWSNDTAAALAGRPFAIAELRRMRRLVMLAVLAGWSVLLWSAFGLLHG